MHFSQDEYQEGEFLHDIIGFRGKNIMQLASLKAPIAPGFIFPSEAIWKGQIEKELSIGMLKSAVGKIEKRTGKTFNSADNPLLFKVLLSPSIQIGTMPSIHALGLNDKVVEGFAKRCGEEFSYGEYFFLMRAIGTRFMGKNRDDFQKLKESHSGSAKYLCELCREKLMPDFPQDAYEQLHLVLNCMSKGYTEDEMNEDIEVGLIVQMMVYGNMGENSYNGFLFSRDIVTGEAQIQGHFGHNEFDTVPEQGRPIAEIDKKYFDKLKVLVCQLEELFLDLRQIKFIIEEDTVWLLEQSPVDGKSTRAEIRTLLDLHAKGLINKEKLANSVPPNQIKDLLHSVIDYGSTGGMETVEGGITGSPGAVVGYVCFSTPKLVAEHRRLSLSGKKPNLILVMPHTNAADVEGIELGIGVVASVGGYSSHAPVVSRSLRKPCVLFPDIEHHDSHVVIGGRRVNEMDIISIEAPTYTNPTIWFGEAKLVFPNTAENGLEEYVKTVSDLSGDFCVTGLMHRLSDVDEALRLGAEGIGMCPIDEVIKQSDSLSPFQDMLMLMHHAEHFSKAEERFKESIQPEWEKLLIKLDGRRLLVRLLEGPLTNFFPYEQDKREKIMGRIVKDYAGVDLEELHALFNQMRSVSPMMGMRGSRVGLNYPHLYVSQLRALLQAAYEVSKQRKVWLDVCVPGVMGDSEIRFLRYGRNIESTVVKGMHHMVEHLLEKWKLDELPFDFRVGASIEMPAAAMMAGHLAKQSDFFLVDALMLTQNTIGVDLEDLNTFLPAFTQYDIFKENPFEILAPPVKQLLAMVIHLGRLTRPDLEIGICGNNIYDPRNIDFAFNADVHFVATNPHGVPVARLAAAQQMLKNRASRTRYKEKEDKLMTG